MRQPAGLAIAAALLLAGLALLAPGAPAFAQEGWRQFIMTGAAGPVAAGSSSQLVENDDWTKYAPRNLFDGGKDSAWVEGVDGDGLGEQVWFTVDRGTADLILTNGFARNASLFQKNNRVKRLEATLWAAATVSGMATELGQVYQARPVSGRLALSLADQTAPQTLALPIDWEGLPVDPPKLIEDYRRSFEVPAEGSFRMDYVLCLEIKEVYRGTAYRDTCIAEIAWTLPRALAGPGDSRASQLAGAWKAEEGAEWEYLELAIEDEVLLFSAFLGGRLYDAGLWYVGEGQLSLDSDGGSSWVYTDGNLTSRTLWLTGEDGHRERYVRAEE